MRRLIHVFTLVAMSLAVVPVFAQDDGDHRMEFGELRRLISGGASPDDALIELRGRGCQLLLNDGKREQLAEWGFTTDQFQILAFIENGDTVFLPSDVRPWEAEELESDVSLVNNAELRDYHLLGYLFRDEAQDRLYRDAISALRGTREDLEGVEVEHFSFHASERVVEALLLDLQALNNELVDAFPQSVANVIGHKTFHLVAVNSERDFVRAVGELRGKFRVAGSTGSAEALRRCPMICARHYCVVRRIQF